MYAYHTKTMGRPSQATEWLKPDNLILVQGWARDGLTLEQIAHNMGIHVATLCEWKNKYSELDKTLKESKEVADRAVENALFKRACGYEYEETVIEETRIGDKVTTHTKTYKKKMPPDTTAQIYWLKNRKPAQWRDRPISDQPEDDTLNAYIEQTERELGV